jgi:hypothetical protein
VRCLYFMKSEPLSLSARRSNYVPRDTQIMPNRAQPWPIVSGCSISKQAMCLCSMRSSNLSAKLSHYTLKDILAISSHANT